MSDVISKGHIFFFPLASVSWGGMARALICMALLVLLHVKHTLVYLLLRAKH